MPYRDQYKKQANPNNSYENDSYDNKSDGKQKNGKYRNDRNEKSREQKTSGVTDEITGVTVDGYAAVHLASKKARGDAMSHKKRFKEMSEDEY